MIQIMWEILLRIDDRIHGPTMLEFLEDASPELGGDLKVQ